MNEKLLCRCISDLRSASAVIKLLKARSPDLRQVTVSVPAWSEVARSYGRYSEAHYGLIVAAGTLYVLGVRLKRDDSE